MKTHMILALIAAGVVQPSAHAEDLNITLQNVWDTGQNLIYALYNTPESFQARKNGVIEGTLPAKPGNQSLLLPNIVPGLYAFTVFNDADGNGELTTGMFGRPKEQFGISNIFNTLWHDPKWDEVKFEVTAGQPTAINVLLKKQ